MKQFGLLIFCAFSLFTSCAFCDMNVAAPGKNYFNNADSTGGKMKIKIGSHTFTATLYDNATAAAFKLVLPMTVTMVELNGNEKYVDLSSYLPAHASHPETIQAGDLMLYGSSTLVLFYKTFSTPYRYTKIGRIDEVTGLASAQGTGNATVTIEGAYTKTRRLKKDSMVIGAKKPNDFEFSQL